MAMEVIHDMRIVKCDGCKKEMDLGIRFGKIQMDLGPEQWDKSEYHFHYKDVCFAKVLRLISKDYNAHD